MGSNSSKPEANVDNKGLANGNIINNGKIEFEKTVSNDLRYIEIAMYISLCIKIIHLLVILLKVYTKRVKKNTQDSKRLEEIVIDRLQRRE